jgi:HK97 family phage prohead protease
VITERALFNLELQVRDLDTGRRGSLLTHLEGRAVPYNTWANVGGYMERFRPGAFAKSINENRKALPLMLFHGRDDLWPIGLATKWSSENDGLYGVWRLNDSPNAQRAAEMARTGELGFLSIGFTDIRSAPELVDDYNPQLGEEHMDRITRIEARLVETSIVPTPAYADAQVTCVRSYRRPASGDPHPRLTAWKREAAGLPR